MIPTQVHPIRRLAAGATIALLAVTGLSACSSGSASTVNAPSGQGAAVGVTLIVKATTNPYFIAMQHGAQKSADELGVKLTLAAGRDQADEESQVQAIENAVARGDKGILITPNGPGVLDAIEKARSAGTYVIALDTAPDPADAVDITFATDNRAAGRLIGEWTANKLDGKKAVIGLLDFVNDKVVSVDVNRNQGFLEGMGIDTNAPDQKADEKLTGKYTGGRGGKYEIVGNEASKAAEDGGRSAMETLLSKRDDINVVYAMNEPAAYGAHQALEAAGKADSVLLVSIDGGCAGVKNIADGLLSATAQQYPLKMAEDGVKAIADLVRTGNKPAKTGGLDFFDTGTALITDDPADGVKSIDTAEGLAKCWG